MLAEIDLLHRTTQRSLSYHLGIPCCHCISRPEICNIRLLEYSMLQAVRIDPALGERLALVGAQRVGKWTEWGGRTTV